MHVVDSKREKICASEVTVDFGFTFDFMRKLYKFSLI